MDPAASVVAYLDGTYLVGGAPAVIAAMDVFAREMRGLGLAVHPRNGRPLAARHDLPMGLQDFWVPELVPVGTLVPYARASLLDAAGSAEAAGQMDPQEPMGGDRTDMPLDTNMEVTQPTAFLRRHAAYMQRL